MKPQKLVRTILLTILMLSAFASFIQFPIPKVNASTTEVSIGAVADGYVYGRDASYPTAHSTAYLANPTGFLYVGQDTAIWYEIDRSFIKFDTTSITNTIIGVKLSLYLQDDASTTDFTVRIRNWTGDAPIDTGDYNLYDSVNYDDGSWSTAGKSTGQWYNITIANFTLIATGSYTTIALLSQQDIDSTTPTGEEYIGFLSSDQSNAPKLYITTSGTNTIDTTSNVDTASFYINGTQYTTPNSTTLASGVYNFTASQYFYDSTATYNFSSWLINTTDTYTTRTITPNITGNTTFLINYSTIPLFEHYNDPPGIADEFLYGTNWYAQTFTPTAAHYITLVRLKMFRDGFPGTLTVSIRATTSDGKPTGADLCSSSVNASEFGSGSANSAWQQITFDTQTLLKLGIKYAIVARALDADGNTDVGWEQSTTDIYPNGNSLESLNSGASWIPSLTRDFLFEEYGIADPVPTIGSLTPSVGSVPFDTQFSLSVTIDDADGIADFLNATLGVNEMLLGWTSSTFSKISDSQNYIELIEGTASQLNTTAYTLTWTLWIRSGYPTLTINLNATVYDIAESSSNCSNPNALTLTETNTPPQQIPQNPPPTPPPETPIEAFSPSSPESSLLKDWHFPWWILFIIAIIIILASTYTKSSKIKQGRSTWNTSRQRNNKRKLDFPKKKTVKTDWKKEKPWD